MPGRFSPRLSFRRREESEKRTTQVLDASYTDPSELRERLEGLFPDKDYEIRVSGSAIALHSPFSRLGSNEYLDGERQLCLDDSESADSSEILSLSKSCHHPPPSLTMRMRLTVYRYIGANGNSQRRHPQTVQERECCWGLTSRIPIKNGRVSQKRSSTHERRDRRK
jgi:hypothetical protein